MTSSEPRPITVASPTTEHSLTHSTDAMKPLGAVSPAVGSAHPSSGSGGEPTEGGVREPSARRSTPAIEQTALDREFEKVAALDLGRIDATTQAHLVRLARILPEAAFHSMREKLEHDRPRDAGRYAVKVLNQWHREGRYA